MRVLPTIVVAQAIVLIVLFLQWTQHTAPLVPAASPVLAAEAGAATAASGELAAAGTANAAALRGKLASGVKSTKLKFSFAIADYDLDAKAWFEAAIVQDNGKATAAIDTMDGVLQIFVDAEPRRLDPSFDIVFCRMVVQAAPEPKKESKLRFATGSKQKVVRAWGG